jgi:hypothetical protein
MKPIEFNKILTGLTADITGLNERRPTAGRLKHLEAYVLDVDELTAMLKSEVLERVKREIWLEADEDIDYAVQAENLQSLLPVEPKSMTADEEDVCAQLNKGLDELVETMYAISSALDRHRSDEDYIKLFNDQLKEFNKGKVRRRAKANYNKWREKVCLGQPSMEDMMEYRMVKLVNLFKKGMFAELVANMSSARHYPNEIVFQVTENDAPVTAKDVHKYYHSLHKICDYRDGMLTVIPLKAGIYFYTHRKDKNASTLRTDFFKYMYKVELVQQEMQELQKRRGARLDELPASRHQILEKLAELVGYGEWVAPATDENILEMLYNALGVGMYELTDEDHEMSETLWSMLELTGNLRVVWQNLIGYFAEHRFFVSTLGSPALNEMFFDTREYYQNIDKGRPSYKRKSKKWAHVQPLLDRFVPRKE